MKTKNRNQYRSLVWIGLSIITLVSCKEKQLDKAQLIAADVVSDEVYSKQFNNWLDEKFNEEVMRSPMLQTYLGIKTSDYGKWDDISPEAETKKIEYYKKGIEYLKDSVDVTRLSSSTKLSYELMNQYLTDKVESHVYQFYDYPVNQMHGVQSELPAFMINMHRIADLSDAKAYISRLQAMKPYFDQVIKNLKIREEKGILLPKFVYSRVLSDCSNIIKGKPFDHSKTNSTLLTDFITKIEELKVEQSDKDTLISQAEVALQNSVLPAYQGLMVFLEAQEKRANIQDGVWKFPKGDAYYTHRLQQITTTNMTSDQIHELGLTEVDRIHAEMREIMKKVNYKGTLQEFFKFMKEDKQFYFENNAKGKETYLKQAVAIIDAMKSKLDQLFITKPKADIVVKPVEAFREKSAGKAFYQQGTPDGTRPGYYYANLYDMKAMPIYQMEALAYHEGIPGHHMQISIAQELEGIPKFRKFGGYTAYIEGWGLYNEYLPKEIGMYSDPYSDFGRLAMELWRACRLVVDTGIHAKKWTREEGIAYYTTNTPNAESDAVKMVERHIVMPGQATAYKIGMNKILELRENARKTLGEKFDIREFHDVVLTNGAVPLTVLETLVNQWVSSKLDTNRLVKL